VVALLVLAAGPGIAAAQPSGDAIGFTGMAGTVVIDQGETVDQVSGMAGTIIIRGTVDGDVSGMAGNVMIAETGTVHGDVSVATGSLTIAGTVDGSVSAGAGNVLVTETGTVGGDFSVGAGSVEVAGVIGGDAKIGAETITLVPGASIDGGLRYDGDLTHHPADVVKGDVVKDDDLSGNWGPGPMTGFGGFPSWADTVYGLFANLILGAILLLVFPSFTRRVADRVAEKPATSGAIGLLALIGTPILLVLIAITIIGIPLAILGIFVYAFAVWVGLVYGEYAVGHWLLARSMDEVNRWYALLLGLVLFAALGLIPILGGLLAFVVLLLGLGALASSLRGAYRDRRGGDGSEAEGEA
jgi:cytoskeletal protein CcmA (bactofilin family)